MVQVIEQKGMTVDHDFGYPFSLSSLLLKKEVRENENEVAKIGIKGLVFLLDRSGEFLYYLPFLTIIITR